MDKFLYALRGLPKIEQLLKVDLFRLADECIDDVTSSDIFKHLEQTSLTKALGISRQQLKLLRLKMVEKICCIGCSMKRKSEEPYPII